MFYAKIDNHGSRQGNMVQTLAKYVALLCTLCYTMTHLSGEHGQQCKCIFVYIIDIIIVKNMMLSNILRKHYVTVACYV